MSAPELISWLTGIALLAALAEALTRLVPRRPAFAHALWLAVLLRSLVPSLPLVSLPVLEAPLAALLPPAPSAPGSTDPSALAPALVWLADPGRALLALWCAGTLVCALRALRRSRALWRAARLARPADASLALEVERCARRLGVPPPRVLSLPAIRSPFLHGVRRPVLYWPEDDEPGARDSVILHELAHVKRRDPWTSAIELVAVCLWWWNPVVRYAVGQSRRFKELACDAWVARERPDARADYARALLAVATPRPVDPFAEALGWIGPASRLRERLRALHDVRPRGGVTAGGIAFLLLAFGLSLPGLGAPVGGGGLAEGGGDAASGGAGERSPTEAQSAALARLGVASFGELERLARSELEADPDDGRAWGRLGWARYGRGDLPGAAAAFLRQYELGNTPSYASYNLACCHALLGDAALALAWLERSVASGYDDPLAIESDEDLAALREDPRFRALVDRLLEQAAVVPGAGVRTESR